MRSILILITFMAISSSVYAQYKEEEDRKKQPKSDTTFTKKKKTKIEENPYDDSEPNVLVNVTPLRAFEPFGTFMFGIEYIVLNRFSIGHDIGYGGTIIPNDDFNPQRRSFRFNTRFKFYTGRESSAFEGKYVALDLGYLYSQENRDESVEVFVIRNAQSFRLIYGYQFVTNNHFVFDIYFGVGYKFLQISTNPPNVGISSSNIFASTVNRTQGNYFDRAYALGFKIGYIISYSK